MILIADSGSTKTHWCLRTANGQMSEFFTDGINPFYQTEQEICAAVSNQLLPQIAHLLWVGPITDVYFYGAGCAFAEKKKIVANAIQVSFRKAQIWVESDLLAAARALFGKQQGVACILGTGSNSCFYDGQKIVQNVSPLGFILGDEGSGAAIGKRLVADLLKNQLPTAIKEKFLVQYQLTPAEILDNVYRKPFPNRFLARLSRFAAENITEPAIYNLIYASFDEFVKRNLLQYDVQNCAVGFVGSVAYHYREVLVKVLKNNQLTLTQIMQNPMKGLIAYYEIITN